MDTRKRGNRILGLMIGLSVAAASLIGAGSSQGATPKLIATVGPGFTISLKTPAGKKVTTLKPGSYAITVNDRSKIHDFKLKGPGLSKVISTVAAVGSRTVTVRLRAGRYQYTCQPHAAAMHGAFTVR